MKKVIPILSLIAVTAILFTACKSKPVEATNANTIRYEDTVGFAQFQNWKIMNERIDPSLYGQAQQPQQQQPVRTVYKTRPANSGGTVNTPTTNQAKVKKGWSKSAKYAVIGGAAGGVLGAVVNKKNRVAGAVIGAVLGGGGGYVLGRSQDKKDGRF